MDAYPCFGREVLRVLGQQVRKAEHRIRLLQGVEAERRFVWALLDLAGRLGRLPPGERVVLIRLRREDLAELAGTNASTVRRAPAVWDRQWVVVARRGQVTVRDVSAFHALAQGRERRRPVTRQPTSSAERGKCRPSGRT